MSHEVETMAYTNAVPWHGLGEYIADAPDIETMRAKAGLTWEIIKSPLFARDALKLGEVYSPVPRRKALVRTDNGGVLGMCSDRYNPVQPGQTLEFFREFVKAGDATLETAGSLRGGQIVWALAKLGADFTLPGSTDKSEGYVLVASPNVPGKALIVKTTAVRVVCNNTLTASLADGKGFRHLHSRQWDAKAMEQAKAAIGMARNGFLMMGAQAKRLAAQELAVADAIDILTPILAAQAGEEERIALRAYASGAVLGKDVMPRDMPRVMQKVLDAYYHAPGADPGTAWGALNAVTYYIDHMAGRNADNRLSNAWTGQLAAKKEQVLDALLAVA